MTSLHWQTSLQTQKGHALARLNGHGVDYRRSFTTGQWGRTPVWSFLHVLQEMTCYACFSTEALQYVKILTIAIVLQASKGNSRNPVNSSTSLMENTGISKFLGCPNSMQTQLYCNRVFPKLPSTQSWHFCQLLLSFYFSFINFKIVTHKFRWKFFLTDYLMTLLLSVTSNWNRNFISEDATIITLYSYMAFVYFYSKFLFPFLVV